jgi:hypothetical protein
VRLGSRLISSTSHFFLRGMRSELAGTVSFSFFREQSPDSVPQSGFMEVIGKLGPGRGCLLVSAASSYELACLYPCLVLAQKASSWYICSVSRANTFLPLFCDLSLYICSSLELCVLCNCQITLSGCIP